MGIGNNARHYHTMQTHYLVAKIEHTDDGNQISMGEVPAGSIIMNSRTEVKTAFNSDGTDLVDIGYVDDSDEFCANLDVSAVGTKLDATTFNAAANKVFTTATEIVCQYDSSDNTNLTTGLAYAIVEYIVDPGVVDA